MKTQVMPKAALGEVSLGGGVVEGWEGRLLTDCGGHEDGGDVDVEVHEPAVHEYAAEGD